MGERFLLCKEQLRFMRYILMHSTIQDILPLLERIAVAQEAIANPAVQEGFFDYGKKVFCNVTKGNSDGWYSLQDGIATTQPPVFRGKIVSISFPTVERNNKNVCKFHLVMQASGQTVVFESGYDCFFSKTILAAVAAASFEVLTEWIQLATYIKELETGNKTLAVSVRASDGTKLSSEWKNEDDWKAIAAVAIANVNGSNG